MKSNTPRARGGTILICVLACLVAITAMLGSTVQTALRCRHAVRTQKQLRQTDLLLEAGVLRAAQQLKSSPLYEGEQWRPRLFSQADRVGEHDRDEDANDEAIVEIRVSETDDASVRSVNVIARLDSQLTSTGPLQRSHQFNFHIAATSSSEN